jgi:hypothetical protein
MRCVFQAMAGFLGRVDSETRCAFWAEEPVDHGFDPGRLIAVDLARTPSAAAAKQIGWGEVQVDDCFTGPNGAVSGTTLGPRWPELRLAGVVYLEPAKSEGDTLTSTAPTPGRPTRPCTAELLAAAELPATTARSSNAAWTSRPGPARST